MILARCSTRILLLITAVACLLFGLTGCQPIDFRDQSLEEPVPLELQPPREKTLVSLPSHRIAPPDILTLEMPKMVPLPPYRAGIQDVLQIQGYNMLPDAPINGYFVVEGEGRVTLGAIYGSVRVAGMTLDEIEETITQQLRNILKDPEISVQLAQPAPTQQVTAQYLVGPDGTINLRKYGSVPVADKTVPEAQLAVQEHLAQYFDSPEVAVNVVGYNSKFYYVITEGAGQGDSVAKVPITGKETVLDAISTVNGLSQMSSKNIWIARPAPANSGHDQILPIEWDAIAAGGETATNYQIMPGDRVFIEEDQTLALTSFIGKVTGPIQQLLGAAGQGVSTVRNTQTLGRAYNLRRR